MSKSCWEHSQGHRGDKTGLSLTTQKASFFFSSHHKTASSHDMWWSHVNVAGLNEWPEGLWLRSHPETIQAVFRTLNCGKLGERTFEGRTRDDLDELVSNRLFGKLKRLGCTKTVTYIFCNSCIFYSEKSDFFFQRWMWWLTTRCFLMCAPQMRHSFCDPHSFFIYLFALIRFLTFNHQLSLQNHRKSHPCFDYMHMHDAYNSDKKHKKNNMK